MVLNYSHPTEQEKTRTSYSQPQVSNSLRGSWAWLSSSLCPFKKAMERRPLKSYFIFSDLNNFLTTTTKEKTFQKNYRLCVTLLRAHWGLKLKGHTVYNGLPSHLRTISKVYKLQNCDGQPLYPWKQMLAWPKCFIMIMINHPWNHCYLLVYNWWKHVGMTVLYSFTNFQLLEPSILTIK